MSKKSAKTKSKEGEIMGERKIIRNVGQHDTENLKTRAKSCGANIDRLLEAGYIDEAAKMVEAFEGKIAAEVKKASTGLPKTSWERLWNRIDKPIIELGVEDFEILMVLKHQVMKAGEGEGTSDWGFKAGIKSFLLAYKHVPEMLSPKWRKIAAELVKNA